MLKICLCMLLFCLCGGAGWLKSREYFNRLSHLQDLIAALKILQGEMTFRKDPLPRILLRGSSLGKGLAGDFFYSTGLSLQLSSGAMLEDVWQEQVDQVYGGTSLTGEDRDILKELSGEIGQTDLPNQEALFQRTIFLLEKQEKAAEEDRVIKGRMYRTLGFSVGALLVIALV